MILERLNQSATIFYLNNLFVKHRSYAKLNTMPRVPVFTTAGAVWSDYFRQFLFKLSD